MMGLPLMTWLRFFLWLGAGLVIYFTYSRFRSSLRDPVPVPVSN